MKSTYGSKTWYILYLFPKLFIYEVQLINLITPITSNNLAYYELPDSSLTLKGSAYVIRKKTERLNAKIVLLFSLHYNSKLIAVSYLNNAQTPEVNCWPGLEQEMFVSCCHIF
jgi:hypothetical protein